MSKAKKGRGGGVKKVVRKRERSDLTLSDTARVEGKLLAADRGLAFSQFVDQLIRTELKRVGKLPPEG